jgi:hypothetical protein
MQMLVCVRDSPSLQKYLARNEDSHSTWQPVTLLEPQP